MKQFYTLLMIVITAIISKFAPPFAVTLFSVTISWQLLIAATIALFLILFICCLIGAGHYFLLTGKSGPDGFFEIPNSEFCDTMADILMTKYSTWSLLPFRHTVFGLLSFMNLTLLIAGLAHWHGTLHGILLLLFYCGLFLFSLDFELLKKCFYRPPYSG